MTNPFEPSPNPAEQPKPNADYQQNYYQDPTSAQLPPQYENPAQYGSYDAGYAAQYQSPTQFQSPAQYGSSPVNYAAAAPKSKIAAALLAFFLGSFGIHNFYLGNTTRGLIQLGLYVLGWLTSWLIIGFVLIFAVGIWAFVEFIMILVGSGKFATDARGVPLA